VAVIIHTPTLRRHHEGLLHLEDPVGEVGVGAIQTIRPTITAPVCLMEEEDGGLEEEVVGVIMVDQLDRHGRRCSTILPQ